MPDQFTEVTRTGFLSRIGSSLFGLIAGPALVIAAIALLWWNEGRAVEAIVGLNAAAESVVEANADAPSPANAGKLVHVVGPLNASNPVQDSDVGVAFPDQVSVQRTVEMYQWKEDKKSSTEDQLGGSQKTTTTYTYSRVWASGVNDSSQFAHPEGHENPEAPISSQRFDADDASLGGYSMDSNMLSLVEPDGVLKPELSEDDWTRSVNAYYNGDPKTPKIGEIRVTYHGLKSGTTISVLAAQSGDGFAAYVAPNGYEVRSVTTGNVSASEMIAQERSAESVLTWFIRLAGTVLMWAGFAWFLSPLSTIAAVVPFLGSLVRGAASFVSLVITIPLTLVVIAIAWFAHRPLLGGGLLLLAAGAFYGLWRWHKARTPHVAVAPAHA